MLDVTVLLICAPSMVSSHAVRESTFPHFAFCILQDICKILWRHSRRPLRLNRTDLSRPYLNIRKRSKSEKKVGGPKSDRTICMQLLGLLSERQIFVCPAASKNSERWSERQGSAERGCCYWFRSRLIQVFCYPIQSDLSAVTSQMRFSCSVLILFQRDTWEQSGSDPRRPRLRIQTILGLDCDLAVWNQNILPGCSCNYVFPTNNLWQPACFLNVLLNTRGTRIMGTQKRN